ncbi:MAG: phytanoyl-CoA dioxygenase family protein, partial [Pyrinomonadaceae bacterium]
MTKLTAQELARYERDGFLVIEGFISDTDCDALRRRAEELVAEFDPRGVVSVFSTHEQARTSDDYFLESGDRIRFFFEEDAFTPEGDLRQGKERSINKIGHALHDLDPGCEQFSRAPGITALVSDLGTQNP